jgi:hypothetical protein
MVLCSRQNAIGSVNSTLRFRSLDEEKEAIDGINSPSRERERVAFSGARLFDCSIRLPHYFAILPEFCFDLKDPGDSLSDSKCAFDLYNLSSLTSGGIGNLSGLVGFVCEAVALWELVPDIVGNVKRIPLGLFTVHGSLIAAIGAPCSIFVTGA